MRKVVTMMNKDLLIEFVHLHFQDLIETHCQAMNARDVDQFINALYGILNDLDETL